MSTQSSEETTVAAPPSRFAYFGDEPEEGGVQAARSQADGSPERRRPIGTPGIPGPAERRLDISELVRTIGMHYTHVFDFPPAKEGDLETVTPVVGKIKLTNSGAALLLTGSVSTTLRMECGRCLSPADLPVEAELDEAFDLIASNNAFSQEEIVAVDEDSPAAVISNNILDLGDLLRQNLLLAAPLQPLCREDCPGIVYDSGATRIADPSEATVASTTASPLRKLAELLEEKRRSESEAKP